MWNSHLTVHRCVLLLLKSSPEHWASSTFSKETCTFTLQIQWRFNWPNMEALSFRSWGGTIPRPMGVDSVRAREAKKKKKRKKKEMTLAFYADPPPLTVRVKPSAPRGWGVGGNCERISKRKIQLLRGGQQGREVQNIPCGLVTSVTLGDTWGCGDGGRCRQAAGLAK